MTEQEDSQLSRELQDMLLNFSVDVMLEQPEDLINHAADYFNRLKTERDKDLPLVDDISGEFQVETRSGNIAKMLGARSKRRFCVVGEVVDPEKDDFEYEKFPKSKEEIERIKSRLQHVFLVRDLDEKELGSFIDAMRPTEVQEGQVIIREGEEGEFFYVIDKGSFDAFRTDKNGQEQCIKNYRDSGSFGEMALLHNQPRSATVKATSDGLLWAVSRVTFTRIIVKNKFDKRQAYTGFLNHVPLLEMLSDYEKMQVCDALSPLQLKEGEVLFKEGDPGNGMYFVDYGAVGIFRETDSGSEELERFTQGEYFEEMSLVRREARQGTAKALEDSRLAFLEVDAFERLLGPCADIMKRKKSKVATK